MSDEELYLIAQNEVESENKDVALWSKAFTLAEGNEEKAKFQYIKLRVEQLSNSTTSTKQKKERAKPKPVTFPSTPNATDEFNIKFIPVSEFSRIKPMPEEVIISRIKEGVLVGQIKNGVWYVSRKELEENASHTGTTSKAYNKSTSKEYITVEDFAKFKGFTVEDTIEMIRNGELQGQLIDGDWHLLYSQINAESQYADDQDTSFTWWQIWGWLGLILGSLYLLTSVTVMPGLSITLLLLNAILMIMVLKFNKYAFLIATVLSFNPILWIINGIYLKNRWNHPKVNA